MIFYPTKNQKIFLFQKNSKMSVPFHLLPALDLPYNHIRFLKCEVRDIRGAMEFIRRGVEEHAKLFPLDKINARYLNRRARRFTSLEEDIDSWLYWAPRMPEAMARHEVNVLRDRVYRLMMEMGPAAEAYHWSISPAWRRPKAVTPWRQMSLSKFRKVKKTSKQALKENKTSQAVATAARTEIEALKMEVLCLQFKNLKL
jgi:hypothetical protein